MSGHPEGSEAGNQDSKGPHQLFRLLLRGQSRFTMRIIKRQTTTTKASLNLMFEFIHI